MSPLHIPAGTPPRDTKPQVSGLPRSPTPHQPAKLRSDLIKNYKKWSTVKAELESLTTEIDLSEQIHMVMECLTRIAEAFQEQFKEELLQGVNDFKTIIGNFEDYPSRPFLAKIFEERPVFNIEMMDLEFERFLQAESSLAGRTPQES